jgi:vacuolar protein sorting-associated protein 13A/C
LITSDGEYINKREQKSIQERPSNVIEGVGYGLKSTFKGIASGVVGVFEKPVEGAQKDGVKGFMKGAYKGLSGLVVKPVSGALDFFSKTTEGIKNNVSMQKEKKVKRIRMIRPFYGRMQLIKGYNEFHAEVIHHLLKIEKGRYKNLNFIDAILHNEIGERRQKVIILTEECFIVSISSLI